MTTVPPVVPPPPPPPPPVPDWVMLTVKEVTDLYTAISRVQQQMAMAEDHLMHRISEVYSEATATIQRVMASVPHQFVYSPEAEDLVPRPLIVHCWVCNQTRHAPCHAR